jgi:predicted TIM-barrel fold metal-dependent hydrolase
VLEDLAPIRRNYLVEDYRRDTANQNVVASVHIEAAWDRSADPLAESDSWIRWISRQASPCATRADVYPHQAQEVARLARDFPNQAFIVNHCGSPIDRDRDGMARWREA